MNHLRDSLRRDDPVAREGAPDEGEFHAMRRRVLAAAGAPNPPRMWLSPAFVAAAAALTCVAAGGVLHLSARHDVAASRTARSVSDEARGQGRDLRRVYFETPSGVRVIWQFESE
jgi:hypothetical protein